MRLAALARKFDNCVATAAAARVAPAATTCPPDCAGHFGRARLLRRLPARELQRGRFWCRARTRALTHQYLHLHAIGSLCELIF